MYAASDARRPLGIMLIAPALIGRADGPMLWNLDCSPPLHTFSK
jgi:hypothetical protein